MHILQALLQCWCFFATRTPHIVETSVLDGPEAEYGRRLAKRSEQLQKVRKHHQLLWTCFLASALATTGAAASALWLQVQWSWLLVPVPFVAWSFYSLTLTARRCRQLYAIVRFYEGGLARLQSCWQGQGISGEEYRPAEHLYAADLYLFGTGSLFEMLCTARTGIGRATLADWLLHPASPAEIRARQKAIIELRDNLELQERWAMAGQADPSRVTASTLANWAAEPAAKFHAATRVFAPILPLMLLAVVALRGFGYAGAHWLVAIGIVAAVELVVTGLSHRRVRLITESVTLPACELGLLVPLLDRFQREQFRSPLLKDLQSQRSPHTQTFRNQITELRLYSWLLDLGRSEYFAAACSLLLWKTNIAILVESWRARNCQRVSEWLEVVGRFEALLCLARYSFENPAHAFPDITPDGPVFFRAESLGHPLLAATKCIPCDVSLNCRDSPIMILSGSNMSGKSTLLRSTGVNAVLAMAGAPVRASRMEMSGLRIACSIAVHDSLLDGKSRFLAEVERLKEILALARARQAIVLLDEVLGGTNSQDRLFGARAVLGQLLQSGAVAIVTTHDLALTELANDFRGRVTNAHFEEMYENGALKFDYRLRPGVLTRTNGARVMAALGLLS